MTIIAINKSERLYATVQKYIYTPDELKSWQVPMLSFIEIERDLHVQIKILQEIKKNTIKRFTAN